MSGNVGALGWPAQTAQDAWPSLPQNLLPGRVQGWPAGTQRTANEAERLLSQAVGWWDCAAYRDGDRLLRNQGTGGELLDLALGGNARVATTNDPRYLSPEATGYVYLPGVASNFMSVPDSDALDITGDLTVIVQVRPDSWTTSAGPRLLSKQRNATGNSWSLQLTTSKRLVFYWWNSAAVRSDFTSSVGVPFNDTDLGWVAATLDVDNGAGGYDLRFWTSVDGVTWTQLGSTVTGGSTTSIQATTTAIEIGSRENGVTEPFAGAVMRAIVRSGVGASGEPGGTTVLDVDCDAITTGSATSFTATTGQTVTINRSTSGRKSVAVPSLANWRASFPQRKQHGLMLLGTDDYLECVDGWQHQLLNFNQGDSFSLVAAVRQWATVPTNARIITKQDIAYTRPGYEFFLPTGTNRVRFDTWNNSLTATTPGTITLGGVTVAVARIDRSLKQAFVSVNAGSEGVSTARDVTLNGIGAFNIGRIAGSGFNDFEFLAAAVWRRPLTAREISVITTYYGG